jgi:uncharacterized protein with PhoU and TrkA domain
MVIEELREEEGDGVDIIAMKRGGYRGGSRCRNEEVREEDVLAEGRGGR